VAVPGGGALSRVLAVWLSMLQRDRHASYCPLCDKSFTSPDQLREHVKGKWHKAREGLAKGQRWSAALGGGGGGAGKAKAKTGARRKPHARPGGAAGSSASAPPPSAKTLPCRDCGNGFLWTAEQQVRHKERGFSPLNCPARCPPCKAKKPKPLIQVLRVRGKIMGLIIIRAD
jgi:hypothetical protein